MAMSSKEDNQLLAGGALIRMVFPHNINFTFLEKICQYFQIPNRFTYYCIIRHNLIYIDKIRTYVL
nr:MAG TPA: hypothetical protein [Bacteriophage sp.]